MQFKTIAQKHHENTAHTHMDEDYTRETQSGDENTQISNIVSKEKSRQANLKQQV